jgi:hypothetical protein
MAKFGLFASTGKLLQEYEGDYMSQDKQFVLIWEKAKSPQDVGQQVASIHLDAGQSVKRVKE